MHRYGGRLKLQFWVGSDMQAMLTFEKRYQIPAYMGHNGWIELDVEDEVDWNEVRELVMVSYKHFALQADAERTRRRAKSNAPHANR